MELTLHGNSNAGEGSHTHFGTKGPGLPIPRLSKDFGGYDKKRIYIF